MKIVVVDSETTGVDPLEARVVTAFIGLWNSETEKFEQYMDLLVNPGVEIPEEAIAVHGVSNTTAKLGMNPVEALEVIFYLLHDWSEYPIVLQNAAFDLTVLNAELVRYGFEPFDWDKRQIVDTLVVDRAKQKYRKGKKNLTRLAEVYGVPVDESKTHEAGYDCFLAVNVAVKQIELYGIPANEEQKEWHREWAEGFESWLRNAKGDPSINISREWPYQDVRATLDTEALTGAKEKEENNG